MRAEDNGLKLVSEVRDVEGSTEVCKLFKAYQKPSEVGQKISPDHRS